ncbi:uncharacterized protein LOC131944185 [Physella acuta]|uniref:uncharacterized protein LOC131944185 n=1 Tax=Physella acuta TaxID=109671 RepID=UPI0027DBF2EA|nr:uncharacterized protein LOC131944185 [Physella acuta]
MFLQRVGLMVSAVLLFRGCSADDQCKSYSELDSKPKTVAASTHHDCYLACLADPNCPNYNWGPNCQITLATSPIDTSSNQRASSVNICVNDPSHCSAYALFIIKDPILVAHAVNHQQPKLPPQRN